MPMKLEPGVVVEMKKPHPCGARLWTLVRVGMDVRLRCGGCGRVVELPRAKAERGIKRILKEDET